MGISRSVTILMAYFMSKGMSYSSAFNKIKGVRSLTLPKPNDEFVKQIDIFQTEKVSI